MRWGLLVSVLLMLAPPAYGLTLVVPKDLGVLPPGAAPVAVKVTVVVGCTELLIEPTHTVFVAVDAPAGVTVVGPRNITFPVSACAAREAMRGEIAYNVSLGADVLPQRPFLVDLNANIGNNTAWGRFAMRSDFRLFYFHARTEAEATAAPGQTTTIRIAVDGKANTPMQAGLVLLSPSSLALNSNALVVLGGPAQLATAAGEPGNATLTLDFRPLRADWQATDLRILVTPFLLTGDSFNLAEDGIFLDVHVRKSSPEVQTAGAAGGLALLAVLAAAGAGRVARRRDAS